MVELPRRPGRNGRDAPRRRLAAAPRRDRARHGRRGCCPFARELGDEDALAGVERILEQGGGAGRQRAAFARGGMDEVLRSLVADTAGGGSSTVARASRLWLDARAARDLERLAELTAEDATWVSPVDGRSSGRDAVVAQVAAGFHETDEFATELLDYEARGDKAVALIRNVATAERRRARLASGARLRGSRRRRHERADSRGRPGGGRGVLGGRGLSDSRARAAARRGSRASP